MRSLNAFYSIVLIFGLGCSQSETMPTVSDSGTVSNETSPKTGILSSRVELLRFNGVLVPFGPEFLFDNQFAGLITEQEHWQISESDKVTPLAGTGIRFSPSSKPIILTQNTAPFYEALPTDGVAIISASADPTASRQLVILLDVVHREKIELSAGKYLSEDSEEFKMEVPIPTEVKSRNLRLRAVYGPSDQEATLRYLSLVLRPFTPADIPQYYVLNGDFEHFDYNIPPHPWSLVGSREAKEDELRLESSQDGNCYLAMNPSTRDITIRQEIKLSNPIPPGHRIMIGMIARGPNANKLLLHVVVRRKNGRSIEQSLWFGGSEQWSGMRMGVVVRQSPATSITIELTCKADGDHDFNIDDIRIVVLKPGERLQLDSQERLITGQ